MKKLAIIGAGRIACDIAEDARKMGVETHCFAWPRGALAKDVVDFWYPVSIFEKESILETCRNVGVDGVVATTELTIAIASYISQSMGLNGLPVSVASEITNKYRNRDLTRDLEGLRHPGYGLIRSERQIEDIGVKFPVVVKPAARGGKRGVMVARTRDEFASAYSYACDDGGCDEVIVEEYIEGGIECSVETLSYHGGHYLVQVTEKESSGAPHCVELGHHQPASLDALMREKVRSVVFAGLTRIGLTNGPCHTEIKVVGGEIYLIEFNARPGGDFISSPLVELSTGYPYLKGAISIALDDFEGIDESMLLHRYAGVCFVTSQTPELVPVFERCQDFDWCYRKNVVSEALLPMGHNDCQNTNYFMYCTEAGRPDFSRMV